MSWYAKPSKGYAIDSDEAIANYKEVVNLLSGTWTMEAICGMLGNMFAESGMNPWRWQNDTVSYSAGYGLVQWTPASGYLEDYGVNVEYFAPNLSVSETTSGAKATDGIAQITVIDGNLSGKFINRTSYCSFYDISGVYPMSNFRQADSLYAATLGWLYHFECPQVVLSGTTTEQQTTAETRYGYASTIYELLTGYEPTDPDTGDTGGGGSGGDSGGETDPDKPVTPTTPTVYPATYAHTRSTSKYWMSLRNRQSH